MNRPRLHLLAAASAAALGLLGATAASGANLVFSESAFLAEAQGVVLEDFEDEPTSGTPDAGGVSQLAFDGFTANTSLPAAKLFDAPLAGSANTTPGGSKYLGIDTDVGGVGASATLIFDPPVYAVGFQLIDAELETSAITLDGVVYPIAATSAGGHDYIGILSNSAFATLTITPSSADSFWSLDDVSMGLDPSPQRFDVFFDEASYLAAAGAVVVEDFEDEPTSGTPDGGALSSVDFSSLTASSAPAAVKLLDAPTANVYNTTPGGAKYLVFDTDIGNTGSVGVLTFAEPASGVGLVLVDVERIDLVAGEVTVSVPGFAYPILPTAPGGETYFGVVADPPLASLEISPDSFDSLWSVDDVAIASGAPPVPTLSPGPLALALLTIALGGFTLLWTRTRPSSRPGPLG